MARIVSTRWFHNVGRLAGMYERKLKRKRSSIVNAPVNSSNPTHLLLCNASRQDKESVFTAIYKPQGFVACCSHDNGGSKLE